MVSGILPVDKPLGKTSQRVTGEIKRLLNVKAGHSGTLDPEASGVLPVLLGRGTKLADFLPTDKAYTAVLLLGIKTTTGDVTGETIETAPVAVTRELLESKLSQFIGEIEQIPPMYSAIKSGGVKLYDLARKGIEIERQKRRITIYDMQILNQLSETEYEISVSCSKGTYIRTLCEDIAAACGTVGTMKSLRRTLGSGIEIKDCIPLESLASMDGETVKTHILTAEQIFSHLDRVTIPKNGEKYFLNGGTLAPSRVTRDGATTAMARAYNESGVFLGLTSIHGENYKIDWLAQEE